MDAMQKTELEKRAVLGLAAVFAVVFVLGPLRSLGLFGADGPAVPPAAVDAVVVTKSVGGMLREGWEKLDQQVASVTARASAAPRAAAAYTAFELRDPLKSFLPKPAALQAEAPGGMEVAVEAPPPPPELRVEGLLWGDVEPKAIINGRVYRVHDRVGGVTILAIDRGGVTVEHLGKPVVYSTASAR
jgi:hypothetical protein